MKRFILSLLFSFLFLTGGICQTPKFTNPFDTPEFITIDISVFDSITYDEFWLKKLEYPDFYHYYDLQSLLGASNSIGKNENTTLALIANHQFTNKTGSVEFNYTYLLHPTTYEIIAKINNDVEMERWLLEDETNTNESSPEYTRSNNGVTNFYVPVTKYKTNSSITTYQCKGITQDGRRCRRMVKGGHYCWQHSK